MNKERNIMMLCFKITGIYTVPALGRTGEEAPVVWGKCFPHNSP